MADPEFLPGEILPAAKLQRLGDDDTYVPSLQAPTTNPDLGTSPIREAEIWLNGMKVDIWWRITFGTGSTAGSGEYRIPIPVSYPVKAGLFDGSFGTGVARTSTSGRANLTVYIDNAGQYMYFRDNVNASLISHSNPWAWADGYTIAGHVSYLTDFGL